VALSFSAFIGSCKSYLQQLSLLSISCHAPNSAKDKATNEETCSTSLDAPDRLTIFSTGTFLVTFVLVIGRTCSFIHDLVYIYSFYSSLYLLNYLTCDIHFYRFLYRSGPFILSSFCSAILLLLLLLLVRLHILISFLHTVFIENKSLASINFWMNRAQSRPSTHYDHHHNILCVVAGQKEGKLASQAANCLSIIILSLTKWLDSCSWANLLPAMPVFFFGFGLCHLVYIATDLTCTLPVSLWRYTALFFTDLSCIIVLHY
jgi:Cupin-like domain